MGYSISAGVTSGGQGWMIAGSPSYRLCVRYGVIDACGFER